MNHFDETDTRTYQQRYWYNSQFWDKEAGPVFLYICGEWTCTPPDEQMFPMMVGSHHNALLITLEHRYYGASQPFDDWSLENLKYLRSEHALADIAYFIEQINEEVGREKPMDWVVIGGSYPGALSAWFKSKYPDHAVGAWSSSGVIHAIKDFKMFDFDIYERTDSSSPDCSDAIRRSIKLVTEDFETEQGTDKICDLFGVSPCSGLNKTDWWFFFADIFTMGVQYGNRVSMCDTLEAAYNTDDATLLQTVATLASGYGIDYYQYDAVTLADTTIDINKNLRQWTYQYCNEFGFFQTPNSVEAMRSEVLEINFWPDYCTRIFGTKFQTETDRTNAIYGGLDITGDNIYFLNGQEDPWQYAGMREIRHPTTTQKNMQASYIECDTCAHCVDFHTPTDDQPQALTDAQNAVAAQVALWL